MPRHDPSSEPATDAALARLDAHYQGMPPVAALRMAIDGYDGDRLRLAAPLSTHVNDKGCAFGGSLGSLLTLAGWGLVQLKLEAAGFDADIFVADSRVRFRAPLYDDLVAVASLADPGAWAGFVAALESRGRGRIQVDGVVPLPDGGPAATMDASFAAILR
ncbi:YiiD C-terminal domain-containing protein [Luteimonas pelagia]